MSVNIFFLSCALLIIFTAYCPISEAVSCTQEPNNVNCVDCTRPENAANADCTTTEVATTTQSSTTTESTTVTTTSQETTTQRRRRRPRPHWGGHGGRPDWDGYGRRPKTLLGSIIQKKLNFLRGIKQRRGY